MTPLDEWREVSARFTDLCDHADVDTWDAPAPVDGWAARDVVRHLVDWFSGFLAGGTGIRFTPGPDVDEDPAAAWHHFADQVTALLEDPATEDRVLENVHIGTVPLPQAVSQFFTADVFPHTWDLARATGQDATLDATRCAELYAGMEPLDEVLRASGQYGPRVPVAADADPQTTLLAFIGRDPEWTPPTDLE